MAVSLLVTIYTSAILLAFTLLITWRKKERITCISGMMIAMAVGMLTGLFAGIILGVLYNGNLFISTVSSMFIGIIIGFLFGLTISLMAVLDGMLAGLMGGMMGAMLGEMINSNMWDTLIKVMFVLYVGLMTTLLYFIYIETMKVDEKSYLSFIKNPIIVMTVLLLYFYFYSGLGPTIDNVIIENHLHK